MNLETYLKQATRGIWGKRRTDAILELRGNIEARIWMLEHQGKTQTQALELALKELGDARAVNAGFVQVEFVPSVLRAAVLAAMMIWTTFPVAPIEARVQARANLNAAGNVLGFQISTGSLEQALLAVPEVQARRFSVARAMDLEQLLRTICSDATVTLEQNRDVIRFTIDSRPRWALTLEVSQSVARAWHEQHRISANSCP